MKLHPDTNDAYRLLHQGTLALARTEQQGFRVDLEYTTNKISQLEKRIVRLEAKFKETDFYKHWVHSVGEKHPNIYSNAQLARYLYKVKKLEQTTNTDSEKQGSTDEETLLQFGIPELTDLLKIRKLKKIKDTYLSAFVREQVNGYIHTSYNLNLVISYRGSSSSPNLQNIPKRDKETMRIVRKALYPRLGHQLLAMDFKALEVRIATAYHKDPIMMKYNKDPTTDMHGDMAKQIFLIDNFNENIPEHKVLRNATKNGFVFPQFYGDYFVNCAKNLACGWSDLSSTGMWSEGDGISLPEGTLGKHLLSKKIFIKNSSGVKINTTIKNLKVFTEHIKQIESHFWGNRFKVYAHWKETHWSKYQRTGYIDLLTGFRCSGVMSKNACINYPVQGSAFHVLLKALILMDEIIIKEKLKTKIIGQIHDEVIFDVYPPELDYIVDTYRNIACVQVPKLWRWINVPLIVESDYCQVDEPWSELKSYKFS